MNPILSVNEKTPTRLSPLSTNGVTQYFLRLIICLGLILTITQAHAQIVPNTAPGGGTNPPQQPGNVSGPTPIAQGDWTTSSYTVAAGLYATSYAWSIVPTTAGTISGTSTTGTLHWNAAFSGTVTVYCTALNGYGSASALPLPVTVTPARIPLVAGTISPASQSVNANTSVTFTGTLATGGNNSYTYQWQSSPVNGGTFVNITGATGQNYTTTGITANTYFQRLDYSNGQTLPTNTAAVLINTCLPLGTNPQASMNYVISTTLKTPGIMSVTDAQINEMGVCQANQTIQYVDGLGRPIQTILVKASPTGRDIVQPTAYDQYDREINKYLPYSAVANTNGSYQSLAITDQASFYANPTSSTWNAPGVVPTRYPTSGTNFEISPLNRPIEQGFSGASWQLSGTTGDASAGHTIKTIYISNDAANLSTGDGYWAQKYTTTLNVDQSGQYTFHNTLSTSGAYLPNSLEVTVSKNENWSSNQSNPKLNTFEKYTDGFGQMVVKRTYNHNKATGIDEILSTYYVHDVYGNLCYVLPPAANPDGGSILQTVLDNLCYQYRYDSRNRLREEKIPGKGWKIMVYNNLNQLIATQDSVQRMDYPQQVSFIKYDAQERVIQTGYYTLPTSVAAGADYSLTLQTTATAQTQNWETKSATGIYSNITIPTSNTTVLVTNYYDDYNIPGLPTAYSGPTGASVMTRGLLTATQAAVLNTPTDVLWAVHYYDDLGRNVKSYAQHYLGGHTSYSTNNYDARTNYYNFTNQLDTTIRQHYTKAVTTTPKLTIFNSYDYDQAGRKLHTLEQISGSNGVAQTPIYLSLANYNEIGQLSSKNVAGSTTSSAIANVVLGASNTVPANGDLTVMATHSITIGTGFSVPAGATFTATIGGYLQTFTYAYNERGWLTAMTPTAASPTGGNYADLIYYDSPTGSATPQYNGNISQFSYNSPKMEAKYNQPVASFNTVNYVYDNLSRLIQSQSALGQSDETVTYDLMGNIKSMVRDGPAIGSYIYTYQNGGLSNLLTQVKKNSYNPKLYQFDGNGNTTSDTTGKILTYNMLNLPKALTNGGTTQATYYYGADGSKLRNVSTTQGTWDYDNGIVYANGKLAFIQTEEGKTTIAADSTTYNYSYDLKDYLGNVRASYDNGGTGGTLRIVQEDDYYPFGLAQSYYDYSNGNRYLYNGKEQQLDLTNQYDYGARFYDPVIARWTSVDPLAETSEIWSPYHYGENNPIKNIDPNGMTDGPYGESIEDLQNLYGSNNVQSIDYGDKTPTNNQPDLFAQRASNRLIAQTSQGYLNTLWNDFNSYDFGGSVTETWDQWLDNPLKSINDAAGLLLHQAGSLITLDGWKENYNGAVNYWNASPEDKAHMDANGLKGALTSIGAFGPLGDISPGSLTTPDGFFMGSITVTTPVDIPVNLYASESTFKYNSFKFSTIAPNSWGGTEWFGRRMLQITPEFQPQLGSWSTTVIPMGTQIQIGLIGPQRGLPFGTWLQLYTPSSPKFQ